MKLICFILFLAAFCLWKLLLKFATQIDTLLASRNGRLKPRLNKISYRVKELFSGDFFGHEEIIDDCKRKCKVFAAEECEIFYLSKEKFYKYFNKDIEEHKQLFQQLIHEPKPKNEAEKFNFYTRFDNMQIKDTIIETDLLRSKKSSAILNAINLNTLQV